MALQSLISKLNLTAAPQVGCYASFFTSIAETLMNHCQISKGVKRYEIMDIEFYLFTPVHPDVITYPRQTKAGQWFFHQSGVVLTFASSQSKFGGILIRGIREAVEGGRLIDGPLKCVDELWDKFNAFEEVQGEYPIIVPSQIPLNSELISLERWIPLAKGKTEEDKIKEW